MKNLMIKRITLSCMLALGLAACGGNKDTNSPDQNPNTSESKSQSTLDKIKSSGTIVLAFRDSSIPFSYVADQPNQPIGYAHDLQLKVVEAVKKQLNMPDLQIRYNLVTSQNRLPLIVNGTADLECGSTTNNEERQKQVDFSNAFFEIGTRLLTAKDSGINGFPDLKGKTVVTTAGTTSERLLKNYNDKEKMGMNIISAKDHGEASLMLFNNRAQAFMMDDILLAGERAKSKNPDNWVIVGEPMSFERYGCMLRKNDEAFKKIVDDTIVEVFHNKDEIDNLYQKWFEKPIPPNNMNLNFPISEQVKDIIANPTDKPAP